MHKESSVFLLSLQSLQAVHKHLDSDFRFKILDISPRIPQDTTEPQETGPQVFVLFFWFNVASTIFQSYHSGVWSFKRAVSSPFGRRNNSVGRGAVLYYCATYLFRTGSSRQGKIYIMGKKSTGMYVVWLSPSGRGVSQAYPGNAEIQSSQR